MLYLYCEIFIRTPLVLEQSPAAMQLKEIISGTIEFIPPHTHTLFLYYECFVLYIHNKAQPYSALLVLLYKKR